jgi:hypothetical protein
MRYEAKESSVEVIRTLLKNPIVIECNLQKPNLVKEVAMVLWPVRQFQDVARDPSIILRFSIQPYQPSRNTHISALHQPHH